MGKRTTFGQQAAAVAKAAAKSNDPALRDAIYTLAQMSKIAVECLKEDPDDEKVAAIMADLVTGS